MSSELLPRTFAIIGIGISLLSLGFLILFFFPSFSSSTSLQSSTSNVLSIDAYVNYGNGTVESRHLLVSVGTTAFTVFNSSWNLETKFYPSLGYYIISVNGVKENKTSGYYWFFYIYSSSSWTPASVGTSSYLLSCNQSIALNYTRVI